MSHFPQPVPTAVKAVIYNDRGELLLQKRDDVPGIWERGLWGHFGGMLEPEESPEDGLRRELREELGSTVGEIGGELFRTDYNTYGILNIAYPVRCTTDTDGFRLGEGQAYGWFRVDELAGLSLSRLIYRHLSPLLALTERLDAGCVERFEQAMLNRLNLRKKSDRVYYATQSPAAIGLQDMILLKELAHFRGLLVVRVCLHRSDDEPIHEMLMAHTAPQSVGPLKQNKSSLSYHMLAGAADVSLHDDEGAILSTIRIDSDDPAAARSVRLLASTFRTFRTVSPYAIFLEVAGGPFVDQDTIWMKQAAEA
jgi:cupin fold WbuC family metalloprotein